MSIDGNGEKGAISCVNWAKIITVYRKYLHSTKKLYASLRTIMDFSYSYVEIWFNECMYGIVAWTIYQYIFLLTTGQKIGIYLVVYHKLIEKSFPESRRGKWTKCKKI